MIFVKQRIGDSWSFTILIKRRQPLHHFNSENNPQNNAIAVFKNIYHLPVTFAGLYTTQ